MARPDVEQDLRSVEAQMPATAQSLREGIADLRRQLVEAQEANVALTTVNNEADRKLGWLQQDKTRLEAKLEQAEQGNRIGDRMALALEVRDRLDPRNPSWWRESWNWGRACSHALDQARADHRAWKER